MAGSNLKYALIVLIGTVLLTVFNFMSRDIMPWHTESSYTNLPEESSSVIDTLKEDLPETGVYAYPGPANDSLTLDESVELHKEGPIAVLFYDADGEDLMSPMIYLRGLLINLLVVSLTVLILKSTNGEFASVFGKSMVVGVVTVACSYLALYNWQHFPMAFTLANSLDILMGFALIALVYYGCKKYLFKF